jgi:hypothetical protein
MMMIAVACDENGVKKDFSNFWKFELQWETAEIEGGALVNKIGKTPHMQWRFMPWQRVRMMHTTKERRLSIIVLLVLLGGTIPRLYEMNHTKNCFLWIALGHLLNGTASAVCQL